jgi:pyrroloquinoline quinone biosynthesis protein B
MTIGYTRRTRTWLLSLCLLGLSVATVALHGADIATEHTPYVVVLGSAQDGGLPQIGCTGPHCVAARANPNRKRLVASLLLADPRAGKRWLIDATPDLREQVELARVHPPTRRSTGPRPALFDGIFLTHAHTGHYAGLIHLGRPAYGAKNLPVFGSARMCGFLRDNGPWGLLVDNGNITLRAFKAEQTIMLGEELSITALPVPHRAEYTDTFAFLVRGPQRTLLYLPDIDKWELWERRIEEVITSVDIALLDGTFYAEGELPGRNMSEIPHPLIDETIRRFEKLPADQRCKIVFTHLNHTNPAVDPDSAATARIINAGMAVAKDGQCFGL